MEGAKKKGYSEMNNPQIIDQLERGPEEFDNIPVEITGNDI